MSHPQIARFDWADPFALDAQLEDEERLVRDTAEAYAQERLLPRVTSAYLDERFDREIMSEMGSSACSARPSRPNMAAPASIM